MKRILAFPPFLFACCLCMAQVTLQPLLPQVGVFQKGQLWNVMAVNSSANTMECYLVLSLQDRVSGAEALSATSAGFTLGKGARQLDVADLTPIQYSYLSSSGQANDFLTVGSYMACFRLMEGTEVPTELAEACVPFDVGALSPPLLMAPADSSVLQSQPAMFTWQPPAPLAMFQQLHYELVIAEILPGQKPEEAVELDAPFYADLDVQGNVMDYSGAYPPFEKGKWYAWQVVARDAADYAAKTDTWDFTIDTLDAPVLRPANGSYILLKSSCGPSSGVNMITGSVLGMKYYSFDKARQAVIRFIGPDGTTVEGTAVQVSYGDNFLGYQLSHKFKKGVVYSVEVLDSKGNKSIAFFVLK